MRLLCMHATVVVKYNFRIKAHTWRLLFDHDAAAVTDA